jgi:hypothetical protein
MRVIFQLSWELCVEVLTTTCVAVFIVVVAFAAEWFIVKAGTFFGSSVTVEASLFKYAVFLFDMFLYGNMLFTLFKKQRDHV